MKKFCRRFLLLFILMISCVTFADAAKLLVPGGQVIGLELLDDTVTVVEFDPVMGAAAQKAGLKKGDQILAVNGTRVTCLQELRSALGRSDGTVRLTVSRGGKTKVLSLCPAATEKGPKLGVYLRQGLTGLGTVTFYDPETGDFGALGHGVNAQSGQLLNMRSGKVYEAGVSGVKKGAVGQPGQLLGSLQGEKSMGVLEKNTDQGIFGKFAVAGEPLPVGAAKEGAATIRSTVCGNSTRDYSVEILKIYPNTGGRTRNMLLRINDAALLAATGGIVQGMSGSPIIQDGKLIGAVTHVLVNDPTTGYGIFIENMLDAAA